MSSPTPNPKPISLIELAQRYNTRDKCLELLESLKWPNGPVCPKCGSIKAYRIKKRRLYECGDFAFGLEPYPAKFSCKRLAVCYNSVYEQKLHNLSSPQGHYQPRPAPFAPQGAIIPLHPQKIYLFVFFVNS